MNLNFSFSLKTFCGVQIAIVTVVVALAVTADILEYINSFGNILWLLRLFDPSSEQSIPTYVSVVNLLLASILILIVYAFERANKSQDAGYWLFLSILFFCLSIDESVSLHEKLSDFHSILVDKEYVAPILNSHQWLLYGLFFVLVVGIVLYPFLRRLPLDTLRNFLVAGSVFVTGAMGLEYVGYLMLDSGMVDSKRAPVFLVKRLFEEGFEMYGVAIFNCALYREILCRKIALTIGVSS